MITQTSILDELMIPIFTAGSPINFIKVVEEVSFRFEQMARDKIKSFLEEADRDFKESENRTDNYYISKSNVPRTIICMFGEITYKRTLYKSRLDGSYHFYVDEKLGIDPYLRYTNDVAAKVAENYSDENSMIKIGIEIGDLIYSKFSLCDNRTHSIPRQTIYNLLKRVKELRIKPKDEKKEVDILYVLIDEKYLPTHLNGDSSNMIKSALICEGLDKTNKKRHKYINPLYFSANQGDFALKLIEFIDDRYDIEKLKSIRVLADGANWIKAIANELKFPGVEMIQYLCKFHTGQALWRICKTNDLYSKALNYLYHNDSKDLFVLLESLKQSDNDDKNIKYIKNNYSLIQNAIHLKEMNCAMEQCISHHIHSEFDNVPKVYSSNNLDRYLSLRDNYRNNENIKLLFIEGLKDKGDSKVTMINKVPLNLSIFDDQVPLPYYSTEQKTGKKLFTPFFNKDYKLLFNN